MIVLITGCVLLIVYATRHAGRAGWFFPVISPHESLIMNPTLMFDNERTPVAMFHMAYGSIMPGKVLTEPFQKAKKGRKIKEIAYVIENEGRILTCL